ncbi:MAG TPA: substrate-binding domain-containing protein, partial [Candidatus Brocadiia bacterium]|nr:substrate-binding domain-containing protein [Candidatus Brocadiia bacterium]
VGWAREVAESFGVALPEDRVVDVSPYAEVAGVQVRGYLRKHKAPQAFFCGTDEVAGAVLTVVQCLGMVVPDDIMVLGYGDYAQAARTLPPLSTVRVPRFQMGVRAVEALARVMEAGPGAPPVRETLEAELVVRKTTRML